MLLIKALIMRVFFYRSGTKTWREVQFRLRNVSANSYWHELLTVFFFSYNLFFPLMIPYIFLQATFFSFTIYNLCSPHLIQSFDFQVNFTQSMQLATFLLIVVLLFTTKNDPFFSAFHNVWMQIKKRMILTLHYCAASCVALCLKLYSTTTACFYSPLVLFNINVWYIKEVFIW